MCSRLSQTACASSILLLLLLVLLLLLLYCYCNCYYCYYILLLLLLLLDYPRLSARQISTRNYAQRALARIHARTSCARMSPVDACSLLRARALRACAPDYSKLPEGLSLAS